MLYFSNFIFFWALKLYRLLFLGGLVEFKINGLISLRSRQGRTYIYIKEEPFYQCGDLILSMIIQDLDENKNDELVSEAVKRSMYPQTIDPMQEFWGHCSAIQAWVDSDYDSHLLHYKLAFPLLRKLVKEGDQKAIEVYYDKVTELFNNGKLYQVIYLIEEDLLNPLSSEKINLLFEGFPFKDILEYDPHIVSILSEKLSEIGIDRLKILYRSREFLSHYICSDEIDSFQDLCVLIDKSIVIHSYIDQATLINYESPAAIIKDNQVKELFLKDCNLNKFPECVKKFPHLTRICL